MDTARKKALKEEIAILQNDIDELEKEKEYLTTLTETRNKVACLTASYMRGLQDDTSDEYFKSYQFRIGYYDRRKLEKLPDYESKWKNSFYERHQIKCEDITTGTLDKERMKRLLSISEESPFRNTDPEKVYSNITTVCVLENIMHTPSGTILTLSDCFGTIATAPIDTAAISLPENIDSLVGHMFTTSIKYNRKHIHPIVTQFDEMPYALYDEKL